MNNEILKIEIFNESDRLTVASILVKNGYKVYQSKERKAPTSRAYTYFIVAEKTDDQKGSKADES